MSQESPQTTELVEFAVASRTIEGESECGDDYAVQPYDNGVLVAVVDGLGHGPEAAVAARIALETLTRYAHEPVVLLVTRCHGALRKTRGVVLSLASFNARRNTMVWLGVGNVEGVLLRANPQGKRPRETLISVGGVVGFQLPSLRAISVPVYPGDTLVFATDGIRAEFLYNMAIGPPQSMAGRICDRFSRDTDDALVLVACYKGLEQ